MLENPAVENGDVTTKEVSTPEANADQSDANVSQDEKTEPKKDANEPFSKSPRFQQMNRKIKEQGEFVKKQSEALEKLMGKLEELTALQKGEEYKPTSKPEDISYDPDSVLQNELDEILEKEDLDDDVYNKVQELAKKYSYEVDGQKIYIPASIALQIYNDFAKAAKPSGSSTPNTKPSNKASEGKISLKSNPNDSLNDVIAKAIRLAEKTEGGLY